MRDPEFFLNTLLVRINRLRTDEQFLADLWRRIAAGNKAEHLLFAFGQALELGSLTRRLVPFGEILREDAGGRGAYIHISVRHGPYRIDQLAIGCTLDEVPRRPGLHQRN